jgi:hypothetical protein
VLRRTRRQAGHRPPVRRHRGTGQVNVLEIPQNWVLRGVQPTQAPMAWCLSLNDRRFLRSLPACRFPAYPQYDGKGTQKQPPRNRGRRRARLHLQLVVDVRQVLV